MTPISATIDIVLILTCASAILYCWQLGRKLKALHDLKSGVGQAIVNLSEAIKTSESARDGILDNARSVINELNETLAKIEDHQQSAQDIVDVMDGQVTQAKRKVAQSLRSAETVAERLSMLSTRSRHEINALTRAVEIAGKVNALTRETSLQRVRGNSERVERNSETKKQEVSPRLDKHNPFIRAVASN